MLAAEYITHTTRVDMTTGPGNSSFCTLLPIGKQSSKRYAPRIHVIIDQQLGASETDNL